MILLSRIAILILKGYFEGEKIIFHEKNLKHKNNCINKCYFCPNFFSYRFIPNFKKLCDFNKLRITLSRKRFFTTWPFPIFWKWFNYYQIQQFVYKIFVLENFFLVSTIKGFFFQKLETVKFWEIFSLKKWFVIN